MIRPCQHPPAQRLRIAQAGGAPLKAWLRGRSCGIPSRPPVAARPLQFLAEYSLNATKSGTVQHTDYLKARPHPHSPESRAEVLRSLRACLTCQSDMR